MTDSGSTGTSPRTPRPPGERLLSPGVLAAGTLTAAYVLVAAVGAVGTGNTEFIFYLAVMVILIGGVLAVHARVRLSTTLLWALAIWGGLHMAGGLVPVPEGWPIHGEVRVLYSWWIIPAAGGGGWLKFDHVVHAYGFATATWLCWEGMRGAVAGGSAAPLRPTFGVCVLLFAAGCGLGATNEIVEFAATRIAETNVGGYENTGWDLVSNAVGAGVAAAVIRLRARRAG